MINIFKKRNFIGIIIFLFYFIFASHSILCAAGVENELRDAQKYYKKGDYELAIKILAAALTKDPANQQVVQMLNDAQKLLDQRNQQLREEKTKKEIGQLDKEAQAAYEKAEVGKAIQLWSKILDIDPGNDNASWMIQKAQTRLQIEQEAAEKTDIKNRSYSKKIKNIADDITRLIEQAKDKLEDEQQLRKEEELAALKEQAKQEEQSRQEVKQRIQKKEEVFIADTFNRGREFYAQGKYSEALREWDSILPLLSQDNELRIAVESLSSAIKEKVELPSVLPQEAAKENELAEPLEKVLTSSKEKDKVGLNWIAQPKILKFGGLFLALILFLVIFVRFILKLKKGKSIFKGKNIGKDFDPSKLREFIEEKRKHTKKKDKDIFRAS